MFWVNSYNQTYKITKDINGTWSDLQDWAYSDYISEGTATNKLKIICENAKITAYVNDGYLTTVADYSLLKGWAGPFVGKLKDPNFDASALFDNATIYVPD